jgi:hypothetical protein
MRDVFSRVYLLNLKRRPDRLAAARAELRKADFPFREPIVFPAIDGHALPTPHGWNVGAGMHGCRQSHVRILEDCILNGVESVLILEDDIRLCDDFPQRCRQFLEAVPSTWEGLMIGGVHRNELRSVTPGVVRCVGTVLTLAYAVRGRLLYELYRHWVSPCCASSIDSEFADIQRRYHVYAPAPFLVMPSGSPSDMGCPSDVSNNLLHERAKLFRTTAQAGGAGSPVLVLRGDVDGERLRSDYSVDVVTAPKDVVANLSELKRWLRENVEAARRSRDSYLAVHMDEATAAIFGTWANVMDWLRQAWDPIIEVRAAEDIAPYLAPR